MLTKGHWFILCRKECTMSKKYDRKHLTLSQHVVIEKGLDSNESFSFDLVTNRLSIDAFR